MILTEHFEEWSHLHYDVYGESGIIAQAYIIHAIYRNQIHKKFNIKFTPILHIIGSDSIVENYAQSILNVFGNAQRTFDLNDHEFRLNPLIKVFGEEMDSVVYIKSYNDDCTVTDGFLYRYYNRRIKTKALEPEKYGKDLRSSCIMSGVISTNNEILDRSIHIPHIEIRDLNKLEELKDFEMYSKACTIPNELSIYTPFIKVLVKRHFKHKFDYFNKVVEEDRQLRFITMIESVALLSSAFESVSQVLRTPYTSEELDEVLFKNLQNQIEVYQKHIDITIHNTTLNHLENDKEN